MKRQLVALLTGSLIAASTLAGTHVLNIHKGWNFLGAKFDMIADELGNDKNITEIISFKDGKWVYWQQNKKDNDLKVIFAGEGLLIKSKEDIKLKVKSINDELISFSNAKVRFKIPLDEVKSLYIDNDLIDLSKNQDIKIDQKDIENFTVILSSEGISEGIHNFKVEMKDGTTISKDLDINFRKYKMARDWSFSTTYGYCGSKTKSITKYASDWAVDLYNTGKGDVYFGDVCRRHDECYENKWGKDYCDSRFYRELKSACRNTYGYYPQNWRERAALATCLYKAWLYYLGVRAGGNSAYYGQ